ncbi:MAG: redoxin domain-containing protein [SAR202 cluster bacterium]|nr:redoxin domain-containing protein [SAR202 cluster bacterium]
MRSACTAVPRRSPVRLRAVAAAAASALVLACAGEAVPTATQVASRPVTIATATPPPTSPPAATAAPTTAPVSAPAATVPAAPPATQLGPGLHDFKLPDAQGGEVALSQYLGQKNVVLVFYRAWW